MKLTRSDFIVSSLVAATAPLTPPPALANPAETALDRYIALPTPEYRYDLVRTYDGQGYRVHVLSMTSQRWRSADEVDKPLWKHWLTVVEPHQVRTRIGALVIGDGSNGDESPQTVDPIIAEIAVRSGALLAQLHMVPNQPLTFAGEHKARVEDDIIAYTWDRYLRTGDDTWPLRLPMTKAAVRAMDTVTAFSTSLGHTPVVDRFVVGGSSKRGWTTWTTAAVDSRVVGIVPVVIDILNIQTSAVHAYRAYGTWPAALQPYESMGITRWLGTPQLKALFNIEDPYTYRERLSVPKLIVNATGDQYFAPDSSQFYFSELPGEKHLRYVANADHSLGGASVNVAQTVLAFLESVIAGSSRPSMTWQTEGEGTLRIRSSAQPTNARLWSAVNPHTRDFRLQSLGRAFSSTDLTAHTDLTYIANVPKPAQGFAAFFVELTYADGPGAPFTVTTDVHIVPDVLPFASPTT